MVGKRRSNDKKRTPRSLRRRFFFFILYYFFFIVYYVQPALLYLVPTVLFPILWIARMRQELGQLWRNQVPHHTTNEDEHSGNVRSTGTEEELPYSDMHSLVENEDVELLSLVENEESRNLVETEDVELPKSLVENEEETRNLVENEEAELQKSLVENEESR